MRGYLSSHSLSSHASLLLSAQLQVGLTPILAELKVCSLLNILNPNLPKDICKSFALKVHIKIFFLPRFNFALSLI